MKIFILVDQSGEESPVFWFIPSRPFSIMCFFGPMENTLNCIWAAIVLDSDFHDSWWLKPGKETKNYQKLLWILDSFPQTLVPLKVISTIITRSSLNQLLSLKSSGLFCRLFFSASVCLLPKLLTPSANQEAGQKKIVSSFYFSCKNFLFSTACYAACGKMNVRA